MRNLKKVLSLALAMVMLLGMMVVGAGAATSFKDDSKIENKVAVAVSNKIGVLIGDDEGNFNPEDTLTRAEAAVAIARLDLGADAAKALTATNAATFKDVGTGYGWAKAYIDYCAGNGYIVGDGNGNFLPGKTVSSVEFAVMVSRMLGYRDKNEDLGGSDWVIKATALARKAGLGTNVNLNTDGMTRDAMAQMVFNALTAPMVEYKGLNISSGDLTITSPATVRLHDLTLEGQTGVDNTTYTNTPATATTPIRLCEEKFPDLKLNKTADDETFGRTLSVWTWKRVEITGTEATVEPDAVFTSATKEADVKKEIGKAKSDDCSLFINGQETSSWDNKDAEDIANLTGNGRLVEVYLHENFKDTIIKVVVVDTALGEVTKVDSKNEKITIKLERVDSDKTVVGAPALTTEVGYNEFKKGDMVLVQGYYNSTSTPNNKLNSKTTVTSVVEAPKVVGLARQKNYSDTTITVDGEARKMSYGWVKDYGFADFAVNNTYDCTLYLDNYDNIIKAIKGAKTNVVDDNLIAVKDAYTTIENGRQVWKVSGTYSNGETDTLTVSSDQSALIGKICTYTGPVNDKYTVTALTTHNTTVNDNKLYVSVTSAQEFNSKDSYGRIPGASCMYADDVKFIFVESDGNTTVLNGRQTQSTSSGTVVAQALRDVKGDGSRYEIIAVFIANEPDVVDISDIIYVHKGSSEDSQVSDDVVDDKDGSRKTIYGYVAYDSNGEPIENFYGTKANMAHKFFKKSTTTIGDYTVHKNTTTTSLYKHTVADATVVFQNGLRGDAFVLNINGDNVRFLGGGAKIVDLSGKWIEDISELNEMADENDVVISVIYNDNSGSDTKSALTIFVESVTPNAYADLWGEDGSKTDATLPTVNAGRTVSVGNGKTLTISKDLIGTVNVEDGGKLIVKGNMDGTITAEDGAEIEVKGDVTGEIDATTDEANTTTTIKINGDIEAGADITADPKTHFEVAGEFNAPINVKVTSTNVSASGTAPNQQIRAAGGYRLVKYTADSWSTAGGPVVADSYANPDWGPLFVHWGPQADKAPKGVVITITDENGAAVFQQISTMGVATVNTQPLNTGAGGVYWVVEVNKTLTAGDTYNFTVNALPADSTLTSSSTDSTALSLDGLTTIMSGSFEV